MRPKESEDKKDGSAGEGDDVVGDAGEEEDRAQVSSASAAAEHANYQ